MPYQIPVKGTLISVVVMVFAIPTFSEILRFPPEAGLLDVTSFGATRNDTVDDTKAIQDAIDSSLGAWPRRIVYLPAGTYRISNMLEGREYDQSLWGGWRRDMIMWGEDRATTIIKLHDNCPGFDNQAAPKAVLRTGSERYGWADQMLANNNPIGEGVQAFGHCIRNLTIDIGSGNPGAIGLDYLTSNYGEASDLIIKSSDAMRRGYIGIAINRFFPGPGLVRNVEIDGFDYGITTLAQLKFCMTFENITLQNQRVRGFDNYAMKIAMRKLTSNNSVPVYASAHADSAIMVLVDATLRNGLWANAAFQGSGGLFLRNISSRGYGKIVDWQSDNHQTVTGDTIGEYCSENIDSLFFSPAKSLNLPVPEPPSYHTNDFTKWVRVNGTTADSIQKAIDSTIGTSKTIVYFPPNTYKYNKTIIVRGNVRKLISCGRSVISPESGVDPCLPAFRIESGCTDPVVFELMNPIQGRVVQNSTRQVVFHNCAISYPGSYADSGFGTSLYNTQAGTGTMFGVDLGAQVLVNPGGSFYCRHLNCEYGGKPLMNNNGGIFWVLGFKDEMGNSQYENPPGPSLYNHPGAVSEILGLFHFSLARTEPLPGPAIVNENGSLSMTLFHQAHDNVISNTILVREKRGDVWREMPATSDLTVPLYVGYTGSALSEKTIQRAAVKIPLRQVLYNCKGQKIACFSAGSSSAIIRGKAMVPGVYVVQTGSERRFSLKKKCLM